MQKRESSLRGYFLRRMKKAGALVYKLVPAGRNNKPDELVLAPHGQHCLVELKKEGEPPRPSQQREHRRIMRRGHPVRVIDTKRGVDLLEWDIREKAAR